MCLKDLQYVGVSGMYPHTSPVSLLMISLIFIRLLTNITATVLYGYQVSNQHNKSAESLLSL